MTSLLIPEVEEPTEPKPAASRLVRRAIALINPLADFGIDTYTHELAMGLVANGNLVDVYTADASRILPPTLPANYRRFAVLGSRLPPVLKNVAPARASSDTPSLGQDARATVHRYEPVKWLRDGFLATQLAVHIKRNDYDFVWTQWPDLASYQLFWPLAGFLGIPIVHTVHNVFPHERSAGDIEMCERAYSAARTLFVHSTDVRDEMVAHFPVYASKVVTMKLGAYTLYRRCAEMRRVLRARWGIPADAVILFAPGVQPYKNIGGCIDALASLGRSDVFLVIAGREAGAPAGDPLSHTRDMIRAAGLEPQVRLLPGYLDDRQIAELFEAGDALMLPYHKSYGSGLLMLGITFGKYVVATRPGMEEAASGYPRAIMLDGCDSDSIAGGMRQAISRVERDPTPLMHVAPELDWRNIAASCMQDIERFIPMTAGRQK